MYGSRRLVYRNVYTTIVGLVRSSKNGDYEVPYNVTGIIKLTGLEELPKGICIDRIIGTWKAKNVEGLSPMKRLI